jgi:hypothetical protein
VASLADEGSAAITTTWLPGIEGAAQIAGLIAAEGCFTSWQDRRFWFKVGMGAVDRELCQALCDYFGVGGLSGSRRRQPHLDDEVTYQVSALRDLIGTIVPFMDGWLPPCHKRQQYERWREQVVHRWETRSRQAQGCAIPGCDRAHRARGLCRQHYYERFRA